MILDQIALQAPILAQFVGGGYNLIQIIVIAMVVAGIIGIALVIARQAGIVIPAFIFTIAWIVLAVVIGVVAIKFLAGFI